MLYTFSIISVPVLLSSKNKFNLKVVCYSVCTSYYWQMCELYEIVCAGVAIGKMCAPKFQDLCYVWS